MYGIVNKGIKDMVINNYGDETWKEIINEAACNDVVFTNMHAYDDATTYNLVEAASKILKLPAYDVLVAFGEYWITYTAKEGYGTYLKMAGDTFSEFLYNLDDLHVRVGNSYKDLRPPSFVNREIDDNTLVLEYHSSREGLGPLVIGLLKGLGKSFSRNLEIQHVVKREHQGHDEFLVKHYPLITAGDEIKQQEGNDLDTHLNKKADGKTQCPFRGQH